MAETKRCSFCHEDREGFYAMLGAFYLTNPFHAGKYFLNAHRCKPREIMFCPLCGRRLEDNNG